MNVALRAGTACNERTTAKPMRCVKLTFPPVVRASWLLMTCRFTSSSLAGTGWTLVAVGTERDSTMFSTIRAAAPRSGLAMPSDAPAPAWAVAATSANATGETVAGSVAASVLLSPVAGADMLRDWLR